MRSARELLKPEKVGQNLHPGRKPAGYFFSCRTRPGVIGGRKFACCGRAAGTRNQGAFLAWDSLIGLGLIRQRSGVRVRRRQRRYSYCPPAGDQGDQPNNQEDEEQDFRDANSRTRDSTEAENPGDQGNHKKNQRPVQHIRFLLRVRKPHLGISKAGCKPM
jgi:hypothetical protein